jgi:succinate dehydrogenase/fumarate reductase flavoprotein subunit
MQIAIMFDLVVVGSGAAGCAAALAAASEGLSVCLLEKANTLGGGTAASLGGLWVGANPLQAAAGISDTPEDAACYLRFTAGGAAIDDNLSAYIRHAPQAIAAYLALGVNLRLLRGLPDHYFPDAPGSTQEGRMIEAAPLALAPLKNLLLPGTLGMQGIGWGDIVAWGGFGNQRNWPAHEIQARRGLLGGGAALIGQFLTALQSHAVTIRTNVRATSLLIDNKRVVGLETSAGQIPAPRGVILASGGYEGNPDLVRRFEGLPEWINSFPPEVEGDGMVMATEIGAATFRLPVNNALLIGCPDPVAPEKFFSLGLRGLSYPGSIVVNDQGSRFCDESQFQDVVTALQRFDRTSHRYVNLPAFMLFDDRYRSRYSVLGGPIGAPPPPQVVSAETLPALAALLGIDPIGLAAEAARFNIAAADSHDPAFGRGQSSFARSTGGDPHSANPLLAPLDTPPFYGLRLRLGGLASGGLLTNATGAVRHVRGHTIPGLYACGNAAAPSDCGIGYQAGTSLGSGITFGWLAARHAAGHNT